MAPLNNTTITKPSTHNENPRAPMAKPSPSKTPSGNGVGRSQSLRGGVSRPGRGAGTRSSPRTSFLSNNSTASDDTLKDEARAENIALMDELRTRLQMAETASEKYQRQLDLLQARLDESQQSHGQLEDQLHENNKKVEELEAEKVLATRQKRELENIFENERAVMLKDREEQTIKEEILQGTIQRLKESLSQREARINLEDCKETSTSPSGQFAPPSSQQRIDSLDQSKLVTQKDKVIESLRLELAEAHIRIMEMDNMGGGQIHELEKKLMEAKITNARLTEDNESFQLLLSEKTLSGDFSKTEAMQTSSSPGSLAEELGTEELDSAEGKSEAYRRLEAEAKSLKDQNKALALYIENIIGRLLQHKDFENIFDKNPELMSGAPRSQALNTDKELPPPPPPKDGEGGGFLQRARSVVAGPGRRPRPTSHVPPAPTTTSSGPNEDPTKAPSIPLGRSSSVRTSSHRRSQSELPNAAPLVNQMYRGPPSSGNPVPLGSPGLSPNSTAARTSFFAPAAPLASPNATPRASSGAGSRSSYHEKNPGSSSNSTFSDHSGDIDSPPRGGVTNNYTGAVMTQNRLRPLRLVQENKDLETSAKKEEEAMVARKKTNRTSWIPAWMGQRAQSGGEQT
ncbi:MAG: hypothetical protein Q9163_001639 [Psora crenata]